MTDLINTTNAPIENINIEDEMKTSYLDYAMSVIVGRALPDVRDGLKPVHRRTIYAMNELGNTPGKPHKKSARIVGDVMGKYHPHGDQAIYDTVVRMAQDFSLRHPLVDGQGNFGSVDGDPAAAMRYTEIRLARLASELLEDIDKDTVDYGPNYDDTETEPLVLPARFPNLLVNGSAGIAVGMATNIPPHNLGEVIDACILLIKKPDTTIEHLMQVLPAPDFPTGGFIYGTQGVRDAYRTGRGSIQMRARAVIERHKKGKTGIVVTELPYQVNKARLIEKIADLVKEKKIEGISDLRDESDREGMRIVIELKQEEGAEILLNQLYSQTQMKTTFGVQLLAIHRNQPVTFNLQQVLGHFIDFRVEVVTRRTRYLLIRAEARAHILEGLKVALDNIDEVVELIRKSKDVPTAREGLMTRFGFTDRQANAILEMRLSRLTGLEREKIEQELKDVLAEVDRLKGILADEKKLSEVIIEELKEIKSKYADERRTEIIVDTQDMSMEDLIVDEEVLVTVSHAGYVKRSSLALYRSQHRGGKGLTGMSMRAEDFAEHIFVASTHSYILFFTDRGRVLWMKVHELPQMGRAARGKAIINLLNLSGGEEVTAFLPVREFTDDHFIVMGTEKGVIKKTALKSYSNPRVGGIIALGLDEGDRLIATALTDGSRHLLLASNHGQGIRFRETDARPMGRTARGVKGMTLGKSDKLIGMESLGEGAAILTVTENGFGKRTKTSDHRVQGRGGMGVITIITNERNGNVIGMTQVTDEDEVMLITNHGKIIRMKITGISVIGRNTQGVKLIGVEKDEKVVGVARLAEKEQV